MRHRHRRSTGGCHRRALSHVADPRDEARTRAEAVDATVCAGTGRCRSGRIVRRQGAERVERRILRCRSARAGDIDWPRRAVRGDGRWQRVVRPMVHPCVFCVVVSVPEQRGRRRGGADAARLPLRLASASRPLRRGVSAGARQQGRHRPAAGLPHRRPARRAAATGVFPIRVDPQRRPSRTRRSTRDDLSGGVAGEMARSAIPSSRWRTAVHDCSTRTMRGRSTTTPSPPSAPTTPTFCSTPAPSGFPWCTPSRTG